MMKSLVRIIMICGVLVGGVTPSYAATNTAKKTTQASASKAKAAKAKASKSASKVNKNKKRVISRTRTPAGSESAERFSALVVDASTGSVLYEKNADGMRYPASLTKMMTLYLTFDALKKGKLSMDETMRVSEKAASQPQTNINLEEGDRLPVRSAIESLVVRSANDSAMVLAETLGGTEWNFALMMTKKAHELGMKDTVFRNPSGLPDDRQYTTAYDMARLGIALRRDFPEYYPYFKLKSFSYNGITYPTHNRVMLRFPGADGLKTGYIRASGFNLVTSVKRDSYNIVAVVMGGSSSSARDDQMIAMLQHTFAELEGKKNHLASLHGKTAKSIYPDDIAEEILYAAYAGR
ncbi:MAG: D-alanyl-D-alanine carboxypeptidase family protein [Rickettsiales bacterium]|nr:D-alanyl-D-alanine carboxypeptidase family protein [Rickettsiales bacterium]